MFYGVHIHVTYTHNVLIATVLYDSIHLVGECWLLLSGELVNRPSPNPESSEVVSLMESQTHSVFSLTWSGSKEQQGKIKL